ncbi:Na+/H+ antiporter NhaC family protein, partial [Virgibacillus sp. DJP39]|uniref:Na+/H+ antiporter NhaC family protein n=1 Tax=Virgibacillus sp. DJP39 TaxID=3409790 RepID=UPI003BB5385C
MENTIWSLVPPLLAIIMVLLTKRVLLSLGVGIIAAALFIQSFNVAGSLGLIWEAFKGIFVADGQLNQWNVFILLFVLILGILTAFISMMGGTRAFGEWMITRVKSRAGAQVMTAMLGVIVFVDDYFNSLTVGQVARPVTDKHHVSRAKLAYIVDSTAAPICVIAPISSWGAYIIGIIGTVFATNNITEFSAFGAFIQIIPMNF